VFVFRVFLANSLTIDSIFAVKVHISSSDDNSIGSHGDLSVVEITQDTVATVKNKKGVAKKSQDFFEDSDDDSDDDQALDSIVAMHFKKDGIVLTCEWGDGTTSYPGIIHAINEFPGEVKDFLSIDGARMTTVTEYFMSHKDYYEKLFSSVENRHQNEVMKLIVESVELSSCLKETLLDAVGKDDEMIGLKKGNVGLPLSCDKTLATVGMNECADLSSCEHSCYEVGINYMKEVNKEYWKEGGELDGTSCAICVLPFAANKSKDDCEVLVASQSKPAYICKNRLHDPQCLYMLCSNCFMKNMLINEGDGRGHRVRRRN
jgi:hypothetical protein